MLDYLAIATWAFGMTAARKAAEMLEAGAPALDAAIAGAQEVEDDPGVRSVGFGGIANACGDVQLDACVMDGKTLSCGGVAAIENIKHAAAVARLVMEKTKHVLLAGDGAKSFAQSNGFPLECLNTPEGLAEWRRRSSNQMGNGSPSAGSDLPAEWDHDTVTVLVRDRQGDLAGACTTSGLAYKLPGRIGDSPLIGHGLYVDNEVGAAGATGAGEEIIRAGGSMVVIEAMRAGQTPQAACEIAIRRVNAVARRRKQMPAHVAFLAIGNEGSVGAASTAGTNFSFALARSGSGELIKGLEIAAAE